MGIYDDQIAVLGLQARELNASDPHLATEALVGAIRLIGKSGLPLDRDSITNLLGLIDDCVTPLNGLKSALERALLLEAHPPTEARQRTSLLAERFTLSSDLLATQNGR